MPVSACVPCPWYLDFGNLTPITTYLLMLDPSMFRSPLMMMVGCVASVALVLRTAAGETWHRFRGENGQGVASARLVPNQWGADDIRWSVKLPGEGHASPIVAGDRVFVMSARPDDATYFLDCYDAHSGETRWQHEIESIAHHLHQRNTFATSTPAVDDAQLYVILSHPEVTHLVVYDHGGREVWRRELGRFPSSHGFGVSPVLFQDLVIVSLQPRKGDGDKGLPGRVVAFDRQTGAPRWRTDVDTAKASYATPCIYEPAAGPPQVILCNEAEGMYGLDATSGEKLWALPLFDKRTVSSPVLAHDIVFASCGSGGGGNYVVAVGLEPRPRLLYTHRRQAPYVPTVVAAGDFVYLWSDKGIVTCLQRETGSIVWRERVEGNYSASPIIVDDRVVGVSDEGEVVVVSASAHFAELGRARLPGPTRGTPSVAHGRIYFRTLTHVVCVGND